MRETVVEKTFSEGVEQQFPSDALGAINVNEEHDGRHF